MTDERLVPEQMHDEPYRSPSLSTDIVFALQANTDARLD